MVEKYKVKQGFMKKLEEWRKNNRLDAANTDDKYSFLSYVDIRNLPKEVCDWWLETTNPIERNKRLIAIINWLNGEDVFEVEKPHNFLVRSVEPNNNGELLILELVTEHGLVVPYYGNTARATAFTSRSNAEEWLVNRYEVVEFDGGGNEVE